MLKKQRDLVPGNRLEIQRRLHKCQEVSDVIIGLNSQSEVVLEPPPYQKKDLTPSLVYKTRFVKRPQAKYNDKPPLSYKHGMSTKRSESMNTVNHMLKRQTKQDETIWMYACLCERPIRLICWAQGWLMPVAVPSKWMNQLKRKKRWHLNR